MRLGVVLMIWVVVFFKQKTAYDMRISDWSSDVCSSDLANYGRQPFVELEPDLARNLGLAVIDRGLQHLALGREPEAVVDHLGKIGRAACRERVCQYV